MIMSIDIKIIMSIDTISVVYIDVKKKTYMNVIVSIDIKIIMSIYIITASLSATRLRCWAAKGAGCPLDIGFRRFVGASFSPKSV